MAEPVAHRGPIIRHRLVPPGSRVTAACSKSLIVGSPANQEPQALRRRPPTATVPARSKGVVREDEVTEISGWRELRGVDNRKEG